MTHKAVAVQERMQEPEPQPRGQAPLTVEVARLWPRQGEWTETEYLALPETNCFVELSKGELIMPPPPSDAHQAASGELYSALRVFAHQHNLGTVRYAPLPVRLWPGKVREPDVLFVAAENADRQGDQFYGPPDLVAEITSPSTVQIDRQQKFVEYAQAGIPEYWILDPAVRTIEVYKLQEGAYVLRERYGPGTIAESGLLSGFQVAVDDIFAT